MNRENEEQKPIAQSLCGALQKEANCKCLVLSVLIYGCLAAVTWCRCTNVTKIVINFSTFPIKSTKNVSPCDEGYIYIPVAFMGMLYLVYLVECYHSPIRIDLLHAEPQSGAVAKLTQLRLAQPTIWWKAISYHYVRRKRQIMRYRNGDNFTTTQVYYERVNSHAATSFYFYDYCGSKDISKELILDPKTPITKITLSKGFAFSNVRSATEFEEARSRFFAEQEYRDDYMEMREGLDLGCNLSMTSLVSVLGRPWFTRPSVYWCLSALLLSWPLRIVIECKTQYAEYQVTKLFGVNYDTPNNVRIHTSASQLSAPGSYMLAPSYSEALLMEPAARADGAPEEAVLAPSYSEALLYERAAAELQPEAARPRLPPAPEAACECPCHGLLQAPGYCISQESLVLEEAAVALVPPPICEADRTPSPGCSGGVHLRAEARICESCLSDAASVTRRPSTDDPEPRDTEVGLGVLRANGRSLESIMEHEEVARALESLVPEEDPAGAARRGAIPKRGPSVETPTSSSGGSESHVTVNPLGCEEPVQRRLAASRSTCFCLKAVLRQNRRRFTLVTPEELESLTAAEALEGPACECETCRSERPATLAIDKHRPLSCHSLTFRRDNSRTLIFASPVQGVCPADPFGGRDLVRSENPPTCEEEALDLPVLSRLRRSLTAREGVEAAASGHRRTLSQVDGQQSGAEGVRTSLLATSPRSGRSETTISLPSYDGLTVPPDAHSLMANEVATSSNGQTVKSRLSRSLTERRRPPDPRRHDPLLRKSFNERLVSGVKRSSLNIETSL